MPCRHDSYKIVESKMCSRLLIGSATIPSNANRLFAVPVTCSVRSSVS